MFTFAGTRASGGNVYTPAASVSYPIPLASKPHTETIAVNGSSTANCPGSPGEPTAASGHLCLYLTRNDENKNLQIDVDEAAQQNRGLALYFIVGEGQKLRVRRHLGRDRMI
jgi:hypothetical protein